MEITAEMKELLEKQMEDYYASYWDARATAEQKAKREAEGKTFKGAVEFARSVAKKYAKGGVCAIPDDLAYWILFHYMENEKEGAVYRSPEEIEAEAKRKKEEAERKAKEAERKAKEISENSLISTSPEDVLKAEEEAKKAKEEAKKVKEVITAEKQKAQAIADKVEQLSLF